MYVVNHLPALLDLTSLRGDGEGRTRIGVLEVVVIELGSSVVSHFFFGPEDRDTRSSQ